MWCFPWGDRIDESGHSSMDSTSLARKSRLGKLFSFVQKYFLIEDKLMVRILNPPHCLYRIWSYCLLCRCVMNSRLIYFSTGETARVTVKCKQTLITVSNPAFLSLIQITKQIEEARQRQDRGSITGRHDRRETLEESIWSENIDKL